MIKPSQLFSNFELTLKASRPQNPIICWAQLKKTITLTVPTSSKHNQVGRDGSMQWPLAPRILTLSIKYITNVQWLCGMDGINPCHPQSWLHGPDSLSSIILNPWFLVINWEFISGSNSIGK